MQGMDDQEGMDDYGMEGDEYGMEMGDEGMEDDYGQVSHKNSFQTATHKLKFKFTTFFNDTHLKLYKFVTASSHKRQLSTKYNAC